MIIILFFLFFMIILTRLFKVKHKEASVLPINTVKKPNKHRLTEILKDIKLEPYGCFINIREHFFLKQINSYSTHSIYDAGIFVPSVKMNEELKTIILKLINNGFDEYGYHILNKYPDDNFVNIKLIELATIGKLSGYSFISVCQLEPSGPKNILWSYSAPLEIETDNPDNMKMLKPDFNYTLIPGIDKYTNEIENTPGKELMYN